MDVEILVPFAGELPAFDHLVAGDPYLRALAPARGAGVGGWDGARLGGVLTWVQSPAPTALDGREARAVLAFVGEAPAGLMHLAYTALAERVARAAAGDVILPEQQGDEPECALIDLFEG